MVAIALIVPNLKKDEGIVIKGEIEEFNLYQDYGYNPATMTATLSWSKEPGDKDMLYVK